jgi:hypothetical protein
MVCLQVQLDRSAVAEKRTLMVSLGSWADLHLATWRGENGLNQSKSSIASLYNVHEHADSFSIAW